MNNKWYLLVFVAFLLFGETFAQTKRQRENITRHYPRKKLRDFSRCQAEEFHRKKNEAYRFARTNDIPTVIQRKDGRRSFLRRIDRYGNLIYVKSYNIESAITIGADKLYNGGGLGLGLSGKGMTIGVWDAGKVRESHELLKGKVTQKDDPDEYDNHATHVTGIMVGKFLNTSNITKRSRGVAFGATADAYDWDEDLSEMAMEAEKGMLVSNHSYGTDIEQIKGDKSEILGVYDRRSRSVDRLAFNAPNYTIVNAAGNDRDNDDLPFLIMDGYNLLAGDMTTAKNVIVVAGVDKVLDYTGPGSVIMSSFSSWGPTNDNRIKPDISADGVRILSSVAKDRRGQLSNRNYAYYWGTSVAAPSVAAGILLLQELSSEVNDGLFLRSATIKAIMAETARQASEISGPDPRYGWGLLNLEKAAKLIQENSDDKNSFYDELILYNKEPYTRAIRANSDNLKVTIAWTDPEGEVQNRGNITPVLINDLDLRITDKNGKAYFPWRLDESDYKGPALNDGDNAVDNVEQVVVLGAIEGDEYTITVNHKGELKNSKQEFSIAALQATPLKGTISEDANDLVIYPNPTSDSFNLYIKKPGKEIDVEIFDLNGRLLFHQTYRGRLNFDQDIDVSSYASSVYLVRITTKGKRKTKKLIVQ